MAYSSISALTGADVSRQKRRKRRRRKRSASSTSVSTPNAILGGQGVRDTARAAEHAHRTAQRRAKKARQQRAHRHTQQRETLQRLTQTTIPRLQNRVQRLSSPAVLDASTFALDDPTASEYERKERLGNAQAKLRSATLEAKRVEGKIQKRRGRRAEPITPLEVAAAVVGATPVGRAASGAGLLARALGIGGKAASTAEKVAPATIARVVEGAGARGAARAAAPRVAATAAERAAPSAVSQGVRSAARAVGRAAGQAPRRAAQGTVRAGRNVGTREGREYLAGNIALGKIATGAGVAPATIGSVVAADVAGTLQANPLEALPTTARALFSSLAYPATALYDVGHTGVLAAENVAAAIRGQDAPNTGAEILGPARGAGEEGLAAITAMEPLISGDPEAVKEATESEFGYAFTPLVPKGIQLAGRGAARGVRAARASEAADKFRERAINRRADKIRNEKQIPTVPGNVRRAAQIVGGVATRNRIKTNAAREFHGERLHAARATKEITKETQKIDRHGHSRDTVEAAVSVLGDYGIGRAKPLENLAQVERSLKDVGASPPEIISTRAVTTALRETPDLLKDAHLWNAVDAYKARARDIETSPVAKYRAQAAVISHDAATILPPERRVPVKAREFTDAPTREAAFRDLDRAKREADKYQGQARTARTKAAELTNKPRNQKRRSTLIEQAKELDAKAAELRETKVNPLRKSLGGYSRGDKPPTARTKRKDWDDQLVDEFVSETKGRATPKGFEEPAYVSHARPRTAGEEVPSGARGSTKAPKIDAGIAERADIVDRSIRSLVGRSVYAPRMRKAMNRFINRFSTEESVPFKVRGKVRRVITDRDWNSLVRSGRLDPLKYVLLPAREWRQALKGEQGETFNLEQRYTEMKERLKAEASAQVEPGGSYLVFRREAAKEFADQINPTAGIIEKALSSTGLVASRAILGYSPAWALSQIVAEGLQGAAAVGPIGLARGFRDMAKYRRENPRGAEDFEAIAGVSEASLHQPTSTRVEMTGAEMGRFSRGIEFIRHSPGGRIIYDAATGRLLGIFDRWKGGKIRSAVLAAHVNKKGLRDFAGGLQGMLKSEANLSNKMKGLSRTEQLQWQMKHPELMERHLRYLDDVMGNWTAYTRFEKAFAPALIFYPYIRMSLRWTFMTYPKHHPVKASILYFLAQQNSNELEKLLGGKPTNIIDYAMPITHGEHGEVSGVLPGGTRFGAPGSNVLIESIGEGNPAGVLRGLNPVLSTAIFGLTGINPFSGEQDATTLEAKGLNALNQLLSMPAPFRATGLNRVGKEPSELSQRFMDLDPNKQLRSFALPFLPQSASDARAENELSTLLEQSGSRPEFEELQDAIEAEDKDAIAAIVRRLAEAREASDKLNQQFPTTSSEEQTSDLYYGGGSSTSSGSTTPGGVFAPSGLSAPKGVLAPR